MSKKIFATIFILLTTIMLSGCDGTGAASSWPGVSINNDIAYVSYGTSIAAVNTSNGSMTWRYPEKVDNRRSFYAAPAVVGDQVFIGDYAGSIYSLNRSNGNERWRFEEGGGRFIASPTFVNDFIIATSTDHHVYALTSTGQLAWKFKTGQAIWAKAASNGERVYVASMDRMLYALDTQTGEELWKLDIGGAVVSNPVLDNESGLLVLATIGGDVTAVRVDTQEIFWTYQCDGAVWSTPVIHDGKVFVGDLTNKFYAIGINDGALAWNITLSAPVIGSIAIMENGLAVASEDGTIVSVSGSGEKLWTRTVEGTLYSPLVNSSEYLIVPVTRGEALLYALDDNGNDQWSFIPPK